MPQKISTHLFTGFLGTGKTSAIRSLIAQKPQHEQGLIIVNEFGEIGIDGAVLAENGIPVAEISGGCLCCSAGAQMDSTIRAILKKNTPQRILIEASGLAHAAGIIDELRTPEFAAVLDIAAVFTLIVVARHFRAEEKRCRGGAASGVGRGGALARRAADVGSGNGAALFKRAGIGSAAGAGCAAHRQPEKPVALCAGAV